MSQVGDIQMHGDDGDQQKGPIIRYIQETRQVNQLNIDGERTKTKGELRTYKHEPNKGN